jgi:hypothetical protein
MKHLNIILQEMYKRVNANFKEHKNEDGWYIKYSWTEDEQNKFEKWLIKYMEKHKEARQELMSIQSNTPIFLQKFAKMFLLNYGWKLK